MLFLEISAEVSIGVAFMNVYLNVDFLIWLTFAEMSVIA